MPLYKREEKYRNQKVIEQLNEKAAGHSKLNDLPLFKFFFNMLLRAVRRLFLNLEYTEEVKWGITAHKILIGSLPISREEKNPY